MKLTIVVSLFVAGCGGADDSQEESIASSESEALQVHAWNHVCRANRKFFLYDNGAPLGSSRGEWVGDGHAVYAYNLAPGGSFVHVGDNVGRGHHGWIQKENLCKGR